MANVISRVYRYLFARKILYGVNTLIYRLALRGLGILNYEDTRVSGEDTFLRRYLSSRRNAIVLDVGANVGDYAKRVMQIEPSAQLYCFEPHPKPFMALQEASERYGFKSFNLGCGSKKGTVTLYDYMDNDGSKHASLYHDVIETIHGAPSVTHVVEVVRLDDFVRQEGLGEIDLLKIDTEGSELDVLKGFSEFIAEKKVKAVHFEFNEMNVASRVYFRDFWTFLSGYDFYRMMPGSLVPIKVYTPLLCEIFAYQNIVALLRH